MRTILLLCLDATILVSLPACTEGEHVAAASYSFAAGSSGVQPHPRQEPLLAPAPAPAPVLARLAQPRRVLALPGPCNRAVLAGPPLGPGLQARLAVLGPVQIVQGLRNTSDCPGLPCCSVD